MKVRDWRIFNPNTRLFWSNEVGWTKEAGADHFFEVEKPNVNLPVDGVWVPYMIGPCTTIEHLTEALKLFPPGTLITGYADKGGHKYNSLKVFSEVLDKDTRKDAEGDESENARLFAVIAAF